MTRRPPRLALVLLVCAASAACGAAPSSDSDVAVRSTTAPASATIDAASQRLVEASWSSTEAPRAFRDRAPLTACGVVETSIVAPPIDDETTRCFLEPGPSGAELVVLVWTPEGDPVVEYLRSRPDAGIDETWIDWTRDDFGPEGWEHQDGTANHRLLLGLD